MNILINIGKDFSPFPAGRYRKTDGKYCGEVFREDYLAPKLKLLNPTGKITIDFDDASGYGSSFLEEIFGGLVRNYGVTLEYFHNHFILKSDKRPHLIPQIISYISEAEDIIKQA